MQIKTTTNIIDYIYCLYEVPTNRKFYIGRTIDPHRRIGEHRLGSKNYKPGDEDKYAYANALDRLSIEWDMEVLMECEPDTEFYEDFFVNKHRHEPLQNMRAGDSEPWMGRDYSNPKEFLDAKQRHLDRAKFRQPKIARESICEPDKMIFSFEDPNKKFESPAMKWLRARTKDKKFDKKLK